MSTEKKANSSEAEPAIASRSTVPSTLTSEVEVAGGIERYNTFQPAKRRDNDPSALEIISNLINPVQEEKASVYMKGHVDEHLINETFLLNAEQQFPTSTLRINCPEHNAPATFFSRHDNAYKCLKCLVEREDLQYIDKKYKKNLEDFEKIKDFVAKSIKDNAPNIHIIAEWKGQIRETLMKVKRKYIDWIETFTNKFVKSLNKIEQSSQLTEFIGEDKRQELRLIDMQDKYHEILKIFYQIQLAKPDDKLDCINHYTSEMSKIHQYITQKDKEMKKITFRLNKAMRETVDNDGLSDKIFNKYMKFMEAKLRTPGPHISPVGSKKMKIMIPKIPKEPERQESDLYSDRQNLGSMVNIEAQGMSLNHPQKKRGITNAAAQQPQQYVEVANASAADLDMSVTSRYRHENQNSIYYLKPNSTDIYLLDFRIKGFLNEQLRWKHGQGVIPLQATSQQTSDSTIYIIGGYRKAGPVEIVALNDCLMIDANLAVYEREKMKIGRYGAALALVRDRFLLALSGCTGDGKKTRHCEAYDTQTNHWFPLQNLPVSMSNTSTVVMNNRFVYLMPGANADCRRGTESLLLHMLDSGSSQIINSAEKSDKTAGWPIGRQVWQVLVVTDPEFVRAQPTAAIQSGETTMIIFGGDTKNFFTFDQREVSQGNKQAKVTMAQTQMARRAQFGNQSDFVARLFRDVAYVIDANEMHLHVYDLQQQKWISSPLSNVGIN